MYINIKLLLSRLAFQASTMIKENQQLDLELKANERKHFGLIVKHGCGSVMVRAFCVTLPTLTAAFQTSTLEHQTTNLHKDDKKWPKCNKVFVCGGIVFVFGHVIVHVCVSVCVFIKRTHTK